MLNRRNRSVRSLLVAAAACAGAMTLAESSALAAWNAGADGLAGTTATSPNRDQMLQSASDLLTKGKPVRARAMLLEAMRGGGQALGDREKERGFKLLLQANRAIAKLVPNELSLQKAELAIAQGDLVRGLTQARAVLASDAITPVEMFRAETLVEQADQRRAELRPLIDPTIRRAVSAFNAGQYAKAKSDFGWVIRTGVELDEPQRQLVENYQMELVGMERRQGGLLMDAPGFETVTLSASQPGVVRKRTDQPATEPAEEPPAEPPTEPGMEPGDDPGDLIADANRAEALRLIGEADAAKGDQRYGEAMSKYAAIQSQYSGSLNTDELNDIARKIQEIRVVLGDQPEAGPGGALDQFATQRQAARDEALATYENFLTQADKALGQGDVDEARELALQARLRIQTSRGLFDESRYEELDQRVNRKLAQIDSRTDAIRIEQAKRTEAQLAAVARASAREQAMVKDRKIREALMRIRDLQINRQYREALDVINNEVLFLDPNNPAGLLLRDIIHDTVIFNEYWDIQRQKQINFAEHSIENERAVIPPLGIIDFPKDWPSLSFSRSLAGQYADSPENRAVLAKLSETRLPEVVFANNTLEEALGFLEAVTQLNVDVDWDALDAINIARDEPISLSLRNIPVDTVLNRIMDKISSNDFGEKAGWAVNDGVLVISSDSELRKNTTLDIYDVRDLIVEVPDYADAPTFDLNAILQSNRGGGGQSPFQDTGGDDRVRVPLQERIDLMKDIIREQIDFDGWRENGGDTGFIQDWAGQLIITNTPANHRDIRGLLSKLREVRAMQINVETRFLLVSQDFFEQIGFDLDVYFNANSNQVTAARAGDPTIIPSDFFDSTGRLVRSVTGANGVTQGIVPPNRFSPIGTISDSLGLAGALMPSEGIASTILGRAPALGIAGQFLDDIQVDFLVQATQADRRTITLTAPRLTFTNGQTSNIFVATQVGFISDLQPVVSQSAVGFDPTIDVISEGVRLVVDGTISADRRYVQLNIDASIAQIEGFESEPVTAVAGGQLVNSADTQSFVQIPTSTVTRVQTTVSVPDQGTILLGGQRLVSETEVESGVPVLSKIPILNRFFSNRIQSKEEQTLLILLKPTILIQSEQEDAAYPGLADSLGAGLGG